MRERLCTKVQPGRHFARVGPVGDQRIETAEFSGRVLMVGCGSIGQAMLPLLRKHLGLPEDGLTVLEASEQGRALAAANHAKFVHCHLKPATFQRELRRRLKAGDLLLNLSVDVSSLDLVEWCADARRAVRGHLGRAVAGRVRQPDADDARAHELSARARTC